MRMFLLSSADDVEIIYWLVGLALGFFIMYWFYYYATGANERKKQLKIQNRILLHIAQKQGVEKDALDILNKLNDEM